ncbi:unnamed protein product, partial [Ectocarpus fasciculatus]
LHYTCLSRNIVYTTRVTSSLKQRILGPPFGFEAEVYRRGIQPIHSVASPASHSGRPADWRTFDGASRSAPIGTLLPASTPTLLLVNNGCHEYRR